MRLQSLILLSAMVVGGVFALDIIDSKCIKDSNCKSDEYCDHDFPNPIGECKEGHGEKHSCLLDRHCASKRCSFFRCKKRIQVKDGPCKITADCLEDQYCAEIKDRDDLRACVNRKCAGVCSKDSQCMSNNCHLFICIKQANSTSC
jgi:hypothetical protein